MLYRRGSIWWYKFRFAGRCVRESSKSTSKDVARRAELKRKRELEEGYHGLKKREAPLPFSEAARRWLEMKRATLAPRSIQIEDLNLRHLAPHFGTLLLTDITAEDVARYQQARQREGAAPKTVNLEIGTLRAVLRRHRLWGNLQPDVRMLACPDIVGMAMTPEEERRLLDACGHSRSKTLLAAVKLAMHTGMREAELLQLRWADVDLDARRLTVQKSKTAAGTGRVVPLNDHAFGVLDMLASGVPDRKPEHVVFPTERYGIGSDTMEPCTYKTDAKKPRQRFKQAWQTARREASVKVRWHDLRHTGVTRMLEGGAPLAVVGSILGWSASTTARMAKRYGHIGNVAQRQAVAVLVAPSDQAATLQPAEVGTELGTVEPQVPLSVRRKLLKGIGSSGRTRTYPPSQRACRLGPRALLQRDLAVDRQPLEPMRGRAKAGNPQVRSRITVLLAASAASYPDCRRGPYSNRVNLLPTCAWMPESAAGCRKLWRRTGK